MLKNINISGSFVQDHRHESVSQHYNPIQASAVGQVMQSNGFELVSLSTGRARHEDKKDFQRTLSRYRGPEISNDGKPVFLDLIYSSRHMGRGVDELWLGIYRVVCTNGLIAGTNFFKFGIRHSGDTYQNLDIGIKEAFDYKDKLTTLIEKAQSTTLGPYQYQVLKDTAINALVPNHAINVRHSLDLVRRPEDQGNTAWAIFNRIQENAMHGRIAYQTQKRDESGQVIGLREMHVRPVKTNSNRDTVLNQSLFDSLQNILNAA